MGKPTKLKKRIIRKVKAGEMTASGRVRQGSAPKANPVADQTNWRQNLVGQRIKFDDKAKELFLAAFADNGRKKHAAMAAGVSVLTVTNHCKNDPDFAQAYDEAQAEYRDKFVAKAIEDLAFKGIPIHKVNHVTGEVFEERRDHPVRLLELELRRIDATYRDKQEINLTGVGGVLVVPAGMTPSEWVADQAKKNETRKNPLQADQDQPEEGTQADEAKPKDVVLPDRAADVAARKAGKGVIR